MKTTMPVLSYVYGLCAFVLASGAMAQNTFNFSYQNVFDSQASDYIVSAVNVSRYTEWQSPPVTYWGPSANGVLGTLTYEFTFGAPSVQISLHAGLAAFNFGGGADGSSSLWGSVNGSSWQLLLNDPTPSSIDSYVQYNQSVPSSLLGSDSFWLQVRMQEDGAPSSYALAQFSRLDSLPRTENGFSISVTMVPEPSTVSLLALGLGAVALLGGCRMRRR